MKKLFEGIYSIDDTLVTKNLVEGMRVYGEKLIQEEGVEYRAWNPKRSKLAAGILNGLKDVPIKHSSKVLYLGAASGTTASHVSDIAFNGAVYCIEISPRVFRDLIVVCESRENMIPILGDARNPQGYAALVENVDLIYQDVAQPNQAEIAIGNSEYYLKPQGYAIIAIKARSVDVTKKPEKVFRQEVKKLKDSGFSILEILPLEPYVKDHALITARFEK